MIRTKDFVVILVTCMLVIIGAGFFFISGDTSPDMWRIEEASFGEPQDGYGLIPYARLSTEDNRNAFIENVRRAYVPPESPPPEPAPTVVEAEIFVPPSETISEENPIPEILPSPTSTPAAHMSTTTGTTSPEESVYVDTGI